MFLFVCFDGVSVLSWQSVLLVEETGGPRENYRTVASHCLIHQFWIHHKSVNNQTVTVAIARTVTYCYA
jgi:hypothetical protein